MNTRLVCKACGEESEISTNIMANLMCIHCDSCEMKFTDNVRVERTDEKGYKQEQVLRPGDWFNSKYRLKGIYRPLFVWVVVPLAPTVVSAPAPAVLDRIQVVTAKDEERIQERPGKISGLKLRG